MKELKTIGIVTGSTDYKENDKLISILTPDNGLIRARAKGVKKPNAKLKYAATPFAFCEYSLISSGSFYVLTTASPIESLMGVVETSEKYLAGSIILEAASVAGEIGESDMFFYLLSTFKKLIYSDVDPFSIAVNFIFYLLNINGFILALPEHKEYNITVEEQKTIEPEGTSRLLLRNLIYRFESSFGRHIKSGELL